MNPQALLDELKKALTNPLGGDLNKAWTTASGLLNYDLQAPALQLYPWGEMMTPLRNELPRVAGNGGDATHWKSITGINTTNLPVGLSEGQRGGVLSSTLVDKVATYCGLGIEDSATFEADYGSAGFDDVRARASEGTLRALMMKEEQMLYGGNSSVALGTTPTPTSAGAVSGGALSDGTYYVACVALTHDGWMRATVAAGVVQTISRTNADGTSDTINGGTAQRSAASSSVTLNAGTAAQRVTGTVTAVTGAVAYAWYLGTSATEMFLQQITTINSVNFNTALVTDTQDWGDLVVADKSRALGFSFDGLLYGGPFASSSGSYLVKLATGTAGTGTVLTTDSAGGITEINTALKAFYDNYKLSPDTMWCNSQEIINITSKVIAGGGAPLFRFNLDANTGNMNIVAGATVGSYLNKITGTLIKVRVHPNAVPGTILFTSKTLPYPQSGIASVAQIKFRRDYYMTEWPLRTRKYEYGCYADEVLQVLFQPAFGVITNIANG